jgi:DNA-binding XRE family transcriptional regulator
MAFTNLKMLPNQTPMTKIDELNAKMIDTQAQIIGNQRQVIANLEAEIERLKTNMALADKHCKILQNSLDETIKCVLQPSLS